MNCNAEIDIEGFSRYTVDFNGDIRSKNYKNTGRKRKLKPALDGNGYLRTMLLGDDDKYHTVKVHRIVAKALCINWEDYTEVNHRNGIKTDNRALNLQWCNRSQNIKHAYDTGLIKPKKGSLNGNSKLKESDVKEIRDRANSHGRYYGRKALAQKYGVSEAHIKDIVNNKNLWKHVH